MTISDPHGGSPETPSGTVLKEPVISREAHWHRPWLSLKSAAWPYLLVFVFSALLYLPTLRFEFVWDDTFFVVQNPAIRTWSALPGYFTDMSTYGFGVSAQMYRPLRNISYLIDFSIGGLSPAVFHAHNILLHALCAALVYWAIRQALSFFRPAGDAKTLPALIGTLLWAAHPVHTEAVAWIKGRDEMLFTAWYLVAFGLMARALAHGTLSPARLAAVLFAFSMSLLSKEMAVSLPLVAVTLIWLRPKSSPGTDVRPMARLVLPASLLLLTIVFVSVRHAVLGQTEQRGYITGSFSTEMLTMTRAWARYLRLAVAPGRLLADYAHWDTSRSILEPRVLISSAAIVLTLGGAILARRRGFPAVAFGIFWFFLTLLPVANFVPTMQFLAERFLYLPLFGPALALSAGLGHVLTCLSDQEDGPRRKRLLLGIAGAVILAFAFSTATRLPDWRSNVTLYSRTYLDGARSPRNVINYAHALEQQGQLEEALQVVEPLVRNSLPSDERVSSSSIFQSYGMLLLKLDRLDEGKAASLQALKADPRHLPSLANMHFYFTRTGEHEKALAYADAGVRISPSSLEQRLYRAHSLWALHRQAELARAYAEMLRDFPERRALIEEHRNSRSEPAPASQGR